MGVTRIVQVGCDLEGSQWAVDTARAYPSVVAAVALHPNEAPKLAEAGTLDAALAEIDRLAGRSARPRGGGDGAGLLPHRCRGSGGAARVLP